MRLLIFGVGKIYNKNKKYISDSDVIVAFLDNNPELWGTQVDGKTVYNPEDIPQLFFEKIVLMSTFAYEMKQQLLLLGCKRECLIHYSEYLDSQHAGEMKMLFPVKLRKQGGDKCLIITTVLGYNGGSLAAIYAAEALEQMGYETVLAAPEGDEVFIKEMRKKGRSFIFYKNLTHANKEELFWINNFKYVIVNTLQMVCCAVELAKMRRVVLWLHEPPEFYNMVNFWEEEIEEGIRKEALRIYAVSSIARRNFTEKYFTESVGVFPYGIPDEKSQKLSHENKRLVFAVVGSVIGIKGQDILLDAIDQMDLAAESQSIFLLIGKILDKNFGERIEQRAGRHPNVWLTGECTRSEMIRRYQEVDVLVIPSREETMSIVATEAMMLAKPCIVSDNAGMAEYIEDYSNGLKFRSGDSGDLAEKLCWCIDNRRNLECIGRNARKTYEDYFSLEVFGKNLMMSLKQEI